MGILSWIILGLIAGTLAKWILPGKAPHSLLATGGIGILGAFVGGWLGSLAGVGGPVTHFSLGSIVTATIGAIVLLAVYHFLKSRS